MPSKRKGPRNRGSRRRGGRVRKGASAESGGVGLHRRLDELIDRIDIVLPEVTARIAALEHLLLELNLCTKDDLRSARQFVRVQEA